MVDHGEQSWAAQERRRRLGERFGAELPSLLRSARGLLRGDGARRLFAPGDLVDEAFVKLAGSAAALRWRGRAAFVKLVEHAMRQILSNAARGARREAQRRRVAAGRRARSRALMEAIYEHVDLQAGLRELRGCRPEIARLMVLCLERGLTPTEAGRSLGLPGARARAMWRSGVGFLRRRLRRPE